MKSIQYNMSDNRYEVYNEYIVRDIVERRGIMDGFDRRIESINSKDVYDERKRLDRLYNEIRMGKTVEELSDDDRVTLQEYKSIAKRSLGLHMNPIDYMMFKQGGTIDDELRANQEVVDMKVRWTKKSETVRGRDAGILVLY